MKETLDTCEDRCDIVCRAPSVLEDIEAQFPIRINIRMEHLAQKFHSRGFVGVRFVKGQQEFECAILEWRIRCGISDCAAKNVPGAKITAFHTSRLSAQGAPDMPPGGSDERRLKSRMSLRLDGVDCFLG